MNEIQISKKQAEQMKDRLDLRPALVFIAHHQSLYDTRVSIIRSQKPRLSSKLKGIAYQNLDQMKHDPQIDQDDMMRFMARLPEAFQELSQLRSVDYVHNQIVPVPMFKIDGCWNGTDVEFVPVRSFPRKTDHPSRILIGHSNGITIFPSALPASVYGDTRCRWLYQLHVFLHEFFHSIELLRRSIELRKQIVLEGAGGGRFTFQSWWEKWETAFTATAKPPCPTRYAATYIGSLDQKTRETDPDRFARALAEQACESFVGYILGIVPNDEDEPFFERHSPELWKLMDMLAKARVIKSS